MACWKFVAAAIALVAALAPWRSAVASTMYIQLPPLMAPLVLPDNERRSGAVTVVLMLTDREHASDVCRMMPRINHALLQAWFHKPLEWALLLPPPGTDNSTAGRARFDRGPQQAAVEKQLVGAVNEAIGKNHVFQVLVFQGAKAGARGSRRCSELDDAGKAAAKAAHGGKH